MATVLSREKGLLIVREQRSNMPSLTKLGSFTREHVVVVAQIVGEDPKAFALRVLGRARREMVKGHVPSAVVVCVDADVPSSVLEQRKKLLLALAEILGIRPDIELTILAPSRCGAHDQLALFSLVEAVVQAAPSVNVRLSFGDSADQSRQRRRSAKGNRQPAAA